MPSERLIYTDLNNNNNKFWHADLADTAVTLEWGRVGDRVPQRTVYSYDTEEKAARGYESKIKAKLKKGYTRQQTLAVARPANVAFIAKVQIQHSEDKETEALIDFLVKRNIHVIEGTTSIRMEAGQLTTPLGPVTAEGLDEAQTLLNLMVKPGANLDNLANLYLRIVPRHIGRRRIEARSLFGTARQLEQEQATLDSLRAVVKDFEQKAAAPTDAPPVFSTKLDIIDGSADDFRRLDKLFRVGVNRAHQSANLKLHRVWQMQIDSAAESFETKLGNIKQLWHGTKDANLLSILKSGFVIAGRGSGIAITGRMFGNGIYFSDQSTKSLNYASGFWGGTSQRKFMLFNDVAMGKEYIPSRGHSSVLTNGPPKGYDSTFAKAGQSGVMNNEMVVYRKTQVNPQFICEFQ